MSKPSIYITRKIPEHILKDFQEAFHVRMWDQEEQSVPRNILLEEVKEVDGLFCMLSDQIDRELFQQASNLKVVANLAVGYDNIDIDEANKNQVVVTNTPDILSETTADLGFSLLLATARRIVEASDYIKQDKWDQWSPYLLAGNDVHHKTIGIVGMGRIGEAIARRAKGFGMNIFYHNRSRKPQAESDLGATYVTFDKLLEESDFVISVVPLTKETEKLFEQTAFEKMKKNAIFINISRGQVVDEEALYEALTTNQIQGAGLDVFEKEPIDSEHPLMKLDQVICLPHIGSSSVETRTKMIELCLENIKGVLNGSGAKTPVGDH